MNDPRHAPLALVRKPGDLTLCAPLRVRHSFGFDEVDLLRPPARLWADGASVPPPIDVHLDARRLEPAPAPTDLLARGPAPSDTWTALTQRSLTRLLAWFLLVEDPQHRLDAHPIVTLAHQASVVQHLLHAPHLRRALLADEVGLGKTIEAGLLIREVLARDPAARVLYLAPARLTRNVRRELDRLGLAFRSWVATPTDRDATLDDPRVVASIHRASLDAHLPHVLAAPPWDMIVVDECHHLSDDVPHDAPRGGRPGAQHRLVAQLAERLGAHGRLLLMSGTPHQGHPDRFRNLLRLLRLPGEDDTALAGRVIYRTKEDVHDWQGRPLFPRRQVNPPLVLDLAPEHRAWLEAIHRYFDPEHTTGGRAAQALQWATSSVHAGLGYLVRHAIRAGFTLDDLPALLPALEALRPYRLGPPDEPPSVLFARLSREIARKTDDPDTDDLDDLEDPDDDARFRPDPLRLAPLLRDAVHLLRTDDARWHFLYDHLLAAPAAGSLSAASSPFASSSPTVPEKIVLFAQPIETVTAFAAYLTRRTGAPPALILGGQTDDARTRQLAAFCDPRGPRFLVSSPAGNEGLNLQIARRLVHLDVPWNPMDLEQRIGRVHRFLSRRTILIDTLVTRHSREVDTYAAARNKLQTIASALVPPDRFEALFSRVMSLVPPDALQDLLGRAPLGPLDDADQARLSDLVHRGFEEWRAFHDRHAAERRAIRTLDPGDATWDDLSLFARRALAATPAEGFTALRFLAQDGDILATPEHAPVLTLDGRPYTCADTAGMPVTRDDGTPASPLGLNLPLLAAALRAAVFPDLPTGAAHLRWPDTTPRPHPGPFGILVAVRQTVHLDQGIATEHPPTLHAFLVHPDGARHPVHAPHRAPLLRALVSAALPRDPAPPAALLTAFTAALQQAETALLQDLRRPTDTEEAASILAAATPILAALIT
ncbi:helicase-related protein [Chondromyces apiculatus]|uniref:Uncharacterized protein n=1 Tax=Chondromyces apiculatus DSM 436 TaxID=1192034 RepID=A0A017THL2_9BACT|nr:helicase-related protein [Chondromyces apiculatus]EYF08397.1 Hypothetical protein CAP_3926 [Chondromyces apiculatus DSM 436]